MQNIITGFFTISGVIVGGIIGYVTAIKVTDRKAFQRAALEFHDAFLDSLMNLDERYRYRENAENNVYEILTKDFDKQIKAMLRFRLYLPVDQREAFDKAWHEYCHYDVNGEPKYPFLEQYFEKSWNGQPTRDLALSRIKNLLGFIECAHKLTFFSGGKIMKRPASLVAAILFFLMAIAQLCRFFLKINIVAAGMEIPVWPSAIAAVVLVALAIWLLKERKS